PSQLYECLLEGVVLFTVLWVFSSKRPPAWSVSGLFLVLYGIFRFAIEFVRAPDTEWGILAFGWLTMGQLLSLPMVIVGLVFLWHAYRQPSGHTKTN
ncbi:MAG: prolipoprotein diacylglyceryl transferase, partial [Pseudomonadota bacterium]|nr:prolipoprotein diacylglyceryl transferase [Pseudomonadota bacterium]